MRCHTGCWLTTSQAWDPASHCALLRSHPQAQEEGLAADVQAPHHPEVQGEVPQGYVNRPATELLQLVPSLILKFDDYILSVVTEPRQRQRPVSRSTASEPATSRDCTSKTEGGLEQICCKKPGRQVFREKKEIYVTSCQNYYRVVSEIKQFITCEDVDLSWYW